MMIRNIALPFLLLLNICCLAQSNLSKPYFYDPAISPDGSEIAFVSAGDIWTVSSGGGDARLLISNPATESRPVYSPDGRFLAFTSTRTGNGDVYTMNIETGEVNRITYDDASEEVSGWSSDGYIYYSSSSKDIAGFRDMFRIKASGGTAMLVAANRYVSEYQGAPSPDGNMLAFVAHGIGSSQWWRNGRSHLDESQIWMMNPAEQGSYSSLGDHGAKELWPPLGETGKDLQLETAVNELLKQIDNSKR